MFSKIKQQIASKTNDQWRDTRVWGFVVFGVVVLIASWSGVRVIETNYELQKKIARLEQTNQVIELQNQNQELKNDYFETDTYLELAARQQFNKAAPGEKLINVPSSVAQQYAKEIPLVVAQTDQTDDSSPDEPAYLRNLKAWRDFVFNHKLQDPDS